MLDANRTISVPLKRCLGVGTYPNLPANNIGPLIHPNGGAAYCAAPRPKQVRLIPKSFLR